MKRSVYALGAVVVLMAVSCQKNAPEGAGVEEKTPVYVELGAVAQSSDASQTKTSLSGNEVHWSTNDSIGVFSPSSEEKSGVRFDAVSVDGKRAVFGAEIVPSDSYVALYPYQENATYDYVSGTVSAYLPFRQEAVSGTFGDGTNLAVAVTSDNELVFKNLCAVVKFTISGTSPEFVSAGFKGAAGELLAGNVSVTVPDVEDPYMTVGQDGASSVLLSGTMKPGNTYCFVLAPVKLNGFELYFSDKDGNSYAVTGSNPVELKRSGVLNLGEIRPEKDSETHISTAEDFTKWMSGLDAAPSSKAVLEDNIVLTGNWTPAAPDGFTGTLDGNGNTISGLSVSGDAPYAGLFASVQAGAVIRNLTVEADEITTSASNGCAGAIAGFNLGTIENCVVRSSGSETLKISAEAYAGAVAGNNSFRIFDSNVMGVEVSVSGSAGAAGGISGVNHGWVEHCSVASSEIAASGIAGNAGGIIGHNSRQSSGHSGYITDCGAGNVTVSAVNAGGLVGTNEGTGLKAGIYMSYVFDSEISGIAGSNSRTGGIVGNSTRAEFVACYADEVTVGSESTQGAIGGLTGYNYNSSIYGCYVSGLELIGTVSGSEGGKGALAGYNGGYQGSGIISAYFRFRDGVEPVDDFVGAGTAPVNNCVDGSISDYSDLTDGSVADYTDAFGTVWSASSLWTNTDPPTINTDL